VPSLTPTSLILSSAVFLLLCQERVLLEQPYLLEPSKTVAEAVKEAVAACGENIQVCMAAVAVEGCACTRLQQLP